MSLPFTNTHMHVFNSACAPDRFLMIVPIPFLRKHPKTIKNLIDTKAGRWIITRLHGLLPRDGKMSKQKLGRYLAFLEVGTDATQQMVFEKALQAAKQTDPSPRIVGLTLNMDFMDNEPSEHMISYETQLEQVKAIKRYYPTSFFPFLGIDPRYKAGAELVSWARPYFESGVVTDQGVVYPYFSGIKLYPALGFFPFDPRLEELYKYAEQNSIPVMTHCTRSGSQYIGNNIESLIPKYPAVIQPAQPVKQPYVNWQKEINERINRYYSGPAGKGSWIKNSDIGENDLACDLFGHPQNYVPLLEKFPKLRICLAHMGGSDEMQIPPRGSQLELIQTKADGWNWFQKIKEMMQVYPNMYTDISYTLSDLDQPLRLQAIKDFLATGEDNQSLAKRVLFGTDFFMTEQEREEDDLYKLAISNLNEWLDAISKTNPQNYLLQPIS